MSILTLIQGHCKRHALNVPTGVIGSTDTTVIQLYEILLQLIDDMVQESNFNVTTRESTFTSIASEDQGAISTLAPYGFINFISETFYDRTLMRPLYGPLDEQEWQQIKALPNPGPFYKFRIRGDHLLLNPTPAIPFSDIAFEYVSSWAYSDAGGTPLVAPTLDTDLVIFPERIIRAGLAFRWKRDKGLPYQADESDYWRLLNNYISRDKAKASINVANPKPVEIKPGVFVPTGNWPV